MEIKELASLIEGKIRSSPKVKNVVIYQGEKYLQVCSSDGDLFNVAIVKTQRKINRRNNNPSKE